ncbi:MAG: hypothetical protein HUJ24_11605 [Rhodobacteraceae bacterium]|nr:hypothetical protein [Paracoccaceae bacterium]
MRILETLMGRTSTESPKKAPEKVPVALKLPTAPAGIGRVHGLPRSGNHAVIKWVMRNLPHQDQVFLNNCVPFRDPMIYHGEVEVNGVRVKQRMRERGHCRPALRQLSGETPPFVLVSYERWVPGMALAEDGRLSQDLDDRGFDFQILVYRSLLNWLASLVMLQRRKAEADGTPEAAAKVVSTQLTRYQQVLGLLHEDRLPGITPVCYDDWFNSDEYRSGRLAALGLPEQDNRLGQVSKYGGGSSFEKVKVGEKLGVESRWKELMPDPEYRAHLARMAQNESFMAALAALFPADADVIASERL